jgi:hypothetical protein
MEMSSSSDNISNGTTCLLAANPSALGFQRSELAPQIAYQSDGIQDSLNMASLPGQELASDLAYVPNNFNQCPKRKASYELNFGTDVASILDSKSK